MFCWCAEIQEYSILEFLSIHMFPRPCNGWISCFHRRCFLSKSNATFLLCIEREAADTVVYAVENTISYILMHILPISECPAP